MQRRRFFKALAKAAAIVALAPQLAFRVKPERIELHYVTNSTGVYEQLKACEGYVDRDGHINLDELFQLSADIKRKRGNQRKPKEIEFLVHVKELYA